MTEEVVEEKEGGTESDRVEKIAKEFGWRPDYDGEDAIDAETFILNSRGVQSSLNRTVKSLRKEVQAMRDGVEAVKRSAEHARDKEIKRLKSEIEELKSRRREAIEEGRVDDVEALDGQIDERKEELTQKPEVPSGPPPEFQKWLDNNQWYNENDEAKAYADALIEHPDFKALRAASPKKFLNKITSYVKKEFPEEFQTDEKHTDGKNPSAPPVTKTTQRGKPPKSKPTAKDLSYEERRVATEFVAAGYFKSLDEYAEKLHGGGEE